MTPAELDRLEALAAAATPGPWDRSGYLPAEMVDVATVGADFIRAAGGADRPWYADAAYIVAACNAVSALVAEVRRLQQEHDRAVDAYRTEETIAAQALAEVRRLTDALELAEARTAVPEPRPEVCGEGGL